MNSVTKKYCFVQNWLRTWLDPLQVPLHKLYLGGRTVSWQGWTELL